MAVLDCAVGSRARSHVAWSTAWPGVSAPKLALAPGPAGSRVRKVRPPWRARVHLWDLCVLGGRRRGWCGDPYLEAGVRHGGWLGRVTVHDSGWRAEWAMPRLLFAVDLEDDLCRALEQRYEVSVLRVAEVDVLMKTNALQGSA